MFLSKSVIAIALVVLISSVTLAEPPKNESDAVTIPLDSVWATSMPGTRDIEELIKKESKRTNIRVWNKILDSFLVPQRMPKKGRLADGAFVVEGYGLEAFRAALPVLTGEKKPQSSVASDKKISLVFFSKPGGSEVQLLSVHRRGKVIELRYRIATDVENLLEMDFALIPLGTLPTGKYEVKITQAPMVLSLGRTYRRIDPPRVDESASLYVSNPFSFEVSE
jgi:hypothetical protein